MVMTSCSDCVESALSQIFVVESWAMIAARPHDVDPQKGPPEVCSVDGSRPIGFNAVSKKRRMALWFAQQRHWRYTDRGETSRPSLRVAVHRDNVLLSEKLWDNHAAAGLP